MKSYDFQKSDFYRAMMTGVFVGFVSTILALIYNIIYREQTRFLPADIINVSSLIFAINLVFWIIGIIYYFFMSSFKKGNIIFLVTFSLVIAYFIISSFSINRSAVHIINNQFRGLLLGVIIIMGTGIILIPLLFNSRKFEETIL